MIDGESLFCIVFYLWRNPIFFIICAVFYITYKFFIRKKINNFKFIFLIIYISLTLMVSYTCSYYSIFLFENIKEDKIFNMKLETQKDYDYFKKNDINLKEIQKELKFEFTKIILEEGMNLDYRTENFILNKFNEKYNNKNLNFNSNYTYVGNVFKIQINVSLANNKSKHVFIPLIIDTNEISDDELSKIRSSVNYLALENRNYNLNILDETIVENGKVLIQKIPYNIYAKYEEVTSLVSPIEFEISNKNIVSTKKEEDYILKLLEKGYMIRYKNFSEVDYFYITSLEKIKNTYSGTMTIYWNNGLRTPYNFTIQNIVETDIEISGDIRILIGTEDKQNLYKDYFILKNNYFNN